MSLLLLLTGARVEAPNANGTWEQGAAAWDATGSVIQNVTATGSWSESASWSASGVVPVVLQPQGGRTVRRMVGVATWEQAAGMWSAVGAVRRPDDLEELILLDVV